MLGQHVLEVHQQGRALGRVLLGRCLDRIEHFERQLMLGLERFVPFTRQHRRRLDGELARDIRGEADGEARGPGGEQGARSVIVAGP